MPRGKLPGKALPPAKLSAQDVKFNERLRELWVTSDLIGHAVHDYARGARAMRTPAPATVKRLRELARRFNEAVKQL